MPPAAPVTRIGPATGWTPLDFRELWDRREVFYLLVWRDVKLRYRHTRVGALWALLQPLMSMVMLTAFGSIVGVKSGGIPYPLFAASGLVPWTYFTHALTQSSNSLVLNEVLLTKIYFPRIMLPMAAVVSGAADFLVAAVAKVRWHQSHRRRRRRLPLGPLRRHLADPPHRSRLLPSRHRAPVSRRSRLLPMERRNLRRNRLT
jgi:hypothetical protein